ncbi:MAG: sporulation protein YabP [Bacilli bacterium]|nr:sporulation protein YabP [Bacilli bacterium]
MNNITGNKHEINLLNRYKLSITGINKINSLNNEEFIIDTIQGNLLIRGSDLTMQQLDIDKGQIWIEGKIDTIEYLDKEEKKKEKEGFFKKIFK